jgi:hypothetical protein
MTNRRGEAWQRRESSLWRGTLVLHKGRIILRIKTGASSGHICDISRTVSDILRVDGRPRRHNTGSAGLGDSSKNAVEGSLKADHLALHDLVEGVKGGKGVIKVDRTYYILTFEAGQSSVKKV